MASRVTESVASSAIVSWPVWIRMGPPASSASWIMVVLTLPGVPSPSTTAPLTSGADGAVQSNVACARPSLATSNVTKATKHFGNTRRSMFEASRRRGRVAR